MERIIYHGGENIVEQPQFGLGNKFNDYGLGFYCCSNKELAQEWAGRKKGQGFVNYYRIRDDRLKILDLTKPPFNNVLYWVALLMHNRVLSHEMREYYPRELDYLEKKYLLDVSKYDIVIGYRADDSYFRFPESCVRSEITLESLNTVFKLGSLGKQYVLISKKAFSLLTFLKFEETPKDSGDNYFQRKRTADKIFGELLIKDRYSDGTRLMDLIKGYGLLQNSRH